MKNLSLFKDLSVIETTYPKVCSVMIGNFFNSVVAEVAEHLEISKEAILSNSRESEIIEARRIIIYLMCISFKFRACTVAKLLGISRSCMSYHFRDATKMIEDNAFLLNICSKIIQKLSQNYSISIS